MLRWFWFPPLRSESRKAPSDITSLPVKSGHINGDTVPIAAHASLAAKVRARPKLG